MPLAVILLLLFILVPAGEIAVLIKVGGVIGVGWTLVLILATAFLGSALIRRQGLGLIAKARREVDQGRPPVREAFSGLCLVVGGLMLLTPGFITDTLGFILLLPPVQNALRRRLTRNIEVRTARQSGSPAEARPRVIEGEFETVDDDPPKAGADLPPPSGGWGRR